MSKSGDESYNSRVMEWRRWGFGRPNSYTNLVRFRRTNRGA